MESPTASLSFVLSDPVRWNEWQYLLHGYAFRCGAGDYLNGILVPPAIPPTTATAQEKTTYATDSEKWNKTVGPVWQFLLQYLSPEFRKIIQTNVPRTGDINAAYKILVRRFESSSTVTIRHTIGDLMLCRGVAGKLIQFSTETSLISQRLKSLLPADMTAAALVDLLTIRQLALGIPDDGVYAHLKSRLNSDLTLTIDLACSEIANVEQSTRFDDLFSLSPSVALSSNKEKFCTFPSCTRPKGHLESECHTKFPHLKKELIKKKEASNGRKAKNVTNLAEAYQPQAWTVKNTAMVATSIAPSNVIRFNMDSGCTDTTVLTFDHLKNQEI
jgi:hypothetical protein